MTKRGVAQKNSKQAASDWRRWRRRGANLVEEMEGEREMPIEVSGVSLIQKSAIYVVMTERRSRVTKSLPPSRPPAKRGEGGHGVPNLDL